MREYADTCRITPIRGDCSAWCCGDFGPSKSPWNSAGRVCSSCRPDYIHNMRGPTIDRSLTRAIWALSWPIAGANFLMRGASIIDTALVGRLGGTALAAVGTSQIVFFLAIATIQGLAVGGQVMVAFHTGAKDPARARAAAGAALASGIGVALVTMLIMPAVTPWLAALMGSAPEVIALAVEYLNWIWWFIAFRSLLIILMQIFQGYGDSRTPLWVIGGVSLVHVAIAYPLIFGAGGFRPWGVAGASFAAGVSECAGVLVLLVIGIRRRMIDLCFWRCSRRDHADVWRTGWPTAGERLSVMSMQFAFARILNRISQSAFAAFRVGLEIEAFSFLLGMGFANAATTLVSQNLGAQDRARAKQSAVITLWLACGYMFVLGLTYFFLGGYWFRVFTTDPEVIRHGTMYMHFAAFTQVPLATALVLAGALRGAGENRWVMFASILFGWGIRVPVAYVATVVLGGGAQWVWFTVVLDWVVRAGWMYLRFRSDNWRLAQSPPISLKPPGIIVPAEVST